MGKIYSCKYIFYTTNSQSAKTEIKFPLGQSDKTKQCSLEQNDCQELKCILGKVPLHLFYTLL